MGDQAKRQSEAFDRKIATSNLASEAFAILQQPPEQWSALMQNAARQRGANADFFAVGSKKSPEEQKQVMEMVLERFNFIHGPKGTQDPSAVREFQFVQGLSPEQRAEFMNIKRASGAKVTEIGGAKGVFDPTSKEFSPITTAQEESQVAAQAAGEKVTAEARARLEVAKPALEKKQRKRQTAIKQAGNTVVQDLGRALNMLPEMNRGEGVIGANVRLAKSKIAGTTEANILKFIDSALSNVGLDRLQQMRESSPTGGALGQVPIAQQLRLEKVLGSLDLGQEPDVIEANIKRVMNVYFDIMNGSAEEREFLVESGEMTAEESGRIADLYFDLPFDETGQPVDFSEQSDEELLSF